MITLSNLSQLHELILADFESDLLTGVQLAANEVEGADYNPVLNQLMFNTAGNRIVSGYSKYEEFYCISRALVNANTGKYTGNYELIIVSFDSIIAAYMHYDAKKTILKIPYAVISPTDGNTDFAVLKKSADSDRIRYYVEVTEQHRASVGGSLTFSTSKEYADIIVGVKGTIEVQYPYVDDASKKSDIITLFQTTDIDPLNESDPV